MHEAVLLVVSIVLCVVACAVLFGCIIVAPAFKYMLEQVEALKGELKTLKAPNASADVYKIVRGEDGKAIAVPVDKADQEIESLADMVAQEWQAKFGIS